MTADPPFVRTWLYAPAHRPELVRKALAGAADAVVIDLEDAVPAAAKGRARAELADLRPVLAEATRPWWVRINSPASPHGTEDLALVAELRPSGVRVPEVEDVETVRAVAALALPLQLTLESALGLARARELATCDEHVASLSLGEADLAADLGVTDDSGLDWARGHVVVQSRAAGLTAPIQSVFTDLTDLDGLAGTTRRWAGRGFVGRSVVHPRQVAVVHDAMRPSPAATDAARAVLEAAESAASRGEAAAVDRHGRFVDPAVVDRARRVLTLADLA